MYIPRTFKMVSICSFKSCDFINCYRLDEKLVVKVVDFGLCRDVYVDSYYKMNNSTAMLMKWLVPEALYDQTYDEKTDVVSISDICLCMLAC